MHNRGVKQSAFFDILTENLTINVPADFPDIQSAHDSLLRTFIPPDVTVTINVAAGHITQTKAIHINHVNGDRIEIIGADPIEHTVANLASMTQTEFAFNLTNATGISAGDIVDITESFGTGHHHSLMGAYRVTAVSSNTVTVAHSMRTPVSALGTVTLNSQTILRKMTTVIFCNQCGGLQINYDRGLKRWRNIALVGDGSIAWDDGWARHGIHVGVRGWLYLEGYVSVIGFGMSGLVAGGASFIFGQVGKLCGNGEHGLHLAYGAGVDSSYAVTNHNGKAGVFAHGVLPGGKIENFISCGNESCGILTEGARMDVRAVVGFNAAAGISSYYNSSINATGSISFRNGFADFQSFTNSNMNVTSTSGYIVQAVYDPAIGVEGQNRNGINFTL